MKVRSVKKSDGKEWIRMRTLLWPESAKEHRKQTKDYFLDKSIYITKTFVIERDDLTLGGFIEVNIRSYAEGADEQNVPYIEGWYVDEDLRGKGLGRDLMLKAERWAQKSGYHYLASDAEIGNSQSINAHQKLGFEEVDRIICFLKAI